MMDDESMDTDDVVAPFQEANNLSQPDSISYPSSFPGCAGASAALVASPVSPPAASPVTKTTEELANMKYISPHAQQVSMAQYNQQAHYYTQQALRDLKTSTEYKKHTMKCHSCGSSWYDDHYSRECKECGGHAMQRPCPICSGYCGKTWPRDVDMSHSMSEAHWDGSCGHQHAAKLLKDMIYMENITDALGELTTSETKQQ